MNSHSSYFDLKGPTANKLQSYKSEKRFNEFDCTRKIFLQPPS